MKFRDLIPILEQNGFELKRTKGSHHQYEGVAGGARRLVTVDFSQPGEDISRKNLASMIRQSGLPKSLFRD